MGFMARFQSKFMSNGLFTATTEVRNVNDDEEEETAGEEVVILRPQSALSGIGAPTRIPVSVYFHQRGFVKFELTLRNPCNGFHADSFSKIGVHLRKFNKTKYLVNSFDWTGAVVRFGSQRVRLKRGSNDGDKDDD